MSIHAMSWALAQCLETAAQQCLLYVIADSADPNGVTRHCDPEYMAEKSRLSRATMFRRLSELEQLDLLSRRKYYTDRGAPRYEICLNLDAKVHVPLKSRRKDDDDDGDGDLSAAETPESHAETLPPKSQPETREVSQVRQTQSHSCDYISPTLSKNLSPNPSPRGSLSKQEAEDVARHDALWVQFLARYPGVNAMDQVEARREFDGLTFDDAEWAVSSALPYASECAKLRRPPKNAHLWLRKAMFWNIPKAKIGAPPPEELWIEEGSEADRAVRLALRLVKKIQPFVHSRAGSKRGYPRTQPVGPDLIAMLKFEGANDLHWPTYARGTPEFAAWQARFGQWTGAGLPTLPGTDSIRVPCQWPPKKDGTIYEPTIGNDGEQQS
jgi:hypothetical protein